MFGPTCWWRVGESPSSPEQREAAKIAAREARAELENVERTITELINAIPEIGALRARKAELRRISERNQGLALYYKFQGGKRSSLGEFNLITLSADGDTWEEVIDKLEQKAVAR